MSDLDLQTVIALLEDASCVMIAAHDRPDGDATGAILGLAHLLSARGKTVRLHGLAPLPNRYKFLVEEQALNFCLEDCRETEKPDIFVVLDCGASDRCDAFSHRDAEDVPVLNIDHHHSNTFFGRYNWVEPEASSTSEMITRLAFKAGWEISLPAAEALWVGIITDTGRFIYENTRAATLQVAARLIELGVEPAKLGSSLYHEESWKTINLKTRALQSLQSKWNNRVAWFSLSSKDFAEFDADPSDSSELVDLARNISGVLLGIFFYELPGSSETKVSIRTKPPLNAIELVQRFGGGGHKRAAGCSILQPLANAQAALFAELETLWGDKLKT
ncbi:MAG: bifunctional oligoribonuclease/PAP phosphatase NrnA [Planctomycetes bacterium]|nr:bifunctional oligoribonuclease/PAP phosphatase NrnA [Planctomycetota bacterium]